MVIGALAYSDLDVLRILRAHRCAAAKGRDLKFAAQEWNRLTAASPINFSLLITR